MYAIRYPNNLFRSWPSLLSRSNQDFHRKTMICNSCYQLFLKQDLHGKVEDFLFYSSFFQKHQPKNISKEVNKLGLKCLDKEKRSPMEGYNIFEMQAVSCGQIRQEKGVKIHISERVYGKATKNRAEDPSMFDLLAWGSDGFEKHAFKKDERFREPTEAYLSMIGRTPWTSEAQENYVPYVENSLEADPEILLKIENYILDKAPQSPQPAKLKKGGKGAHENHRKQDKPEKKENRYNVSSYLSPKAQRKVPEGTESQKNFIRSSSGDHEGPREKGKEVRKESKVKYENQHKQMQGKGYGQSLEKTRLEEREVGEEEQEKLIEKFKQTTRWIPNSAFTTYFGKPPFENYGRGNTHPVDGGLLYGTYLYSHNVHPHRGANQPSNLQSYPVALSKARSHGNLFPTGPRTRPAPSISGQSTQGKIEPEPNSFVGELGIVAPRLQQMEKFGGKGRSRVVTQQARH